MNNLIDTLMNIEVFAFIGLLMWLFFKEFEPGESEDADT